ncbi:MAG TPA: tetratricopeptide repeat protein [Chitinophagales bacterium]|nr:tetratricopeptide repeat protein [Chitinophagales bacterium]
MKAKKKQPEKAAVKPAGKPYYIKWLPVVLVAITFMVYFNSLHNEFLNTWDDNYYVTGNKDLQSLDALKPFTEYRAGNYHPLTMLSLYADYKVWGLSASGFHTTNMLLHLLNSLLVFGFIYLLAGRPCVAFITALLFAIHPTHVESVAWISERKDVLYAFFYLAGLCTYVLYIKDGQRRALLYGLTFLLFIAGALSKAMAVSLPLAFFAIDYFAGRKFTAKTFLEKVPFLLLALVFGYVAVLAQQSINSLGAIPQFSLIERFVFVSYSVVMYLLKAVVPAGLSCLYPYPAAIGAFYYLAPVLLLALAGLLVYSVRFGKTVIFGAAFFIITIALVLQIMPVGDAIMADRYTYLPYIGLFFIFATWVDKQFVGAVADNQVLKRLAAGATLVALLCFSVLTIQSIKVWHDDLSLWNDAVMKNSQSSKAYCNRGTAYYNAGRLPEATEDFSNAIRLKANYPDALYNRGLTYLNMNKLPEAIEDFTNAVRYSPDYVTAYSNRGVAYANMGKPELAIADFSSAIKIDPAFADAYSNRGLVNNMMGNYQQALTDLETANRLGHATDPALLESIRTRLSEAR